MEKVIAVVDASLGTRSRAAHGYVLESRCGNFRIVGVGAIDCDEDDLESTTAELWSQIAIQTIINIVCGDNIDSLVKTKLEPSILNTLRDTKIVNKNFAMKKHRNLYD